MNIREEVVWVSNDQVRIVKMYQSTEDAFGDWWTRCSACGGSYNVDGHEVREDTLCEDCFPGRVS